MMNRKGDKGSPCLTPLSISNSAVSAPLTRTEALEEVTIAFIQSLQDFGEEEPTVVRTRVVSLGHESCSDGQTRVVSLDTGRVPWAVIISSSNPHTSHDTFANDGVYKGMKTFVIQFLLVYTMTRQIKIFLNNRIFIKVEPSEQLKTQQNTLRSVVLFEVAFATNTKPQKVDIYNLILLENNQARYSLANSIARHALARTFSERCGVICHLSIGDPSLLINKDTVGEFDFQFSRFECRDAQSIDEYQIKFIKSSESLILRWYQSGK
ncbi:hypothetical protein LXL04_012995 [Taraxacum kok-saghyz]